MEGQIFKSLREAAAFAREVASSSNRAVRVKFDDGAWLVYTSQFAEALPVGNHEDYGDDEEYWSDLYQYELESDGPLAQLEGYVEDYARSEEEGWYYSDGTELKH